MQINKLTWITKYILLQQSKDGEEENRSRNTALFDPASDVAGLEFSVVELYSLLTLVEESISQALVDF